MRPRAIVRCGIWIAMRRAAIVMATTPPTTRDHHRRRARAGEKASIAPVVYERERVTIAGQKRSTIEKKIIKHAPLPRPRSVICSPSHITNIAPVVSTNVIGILKPKPGLRHGALQRLGEQREAPPCTTASSDRGVARPLR